MIELHLSGKNYVSIAEHDGLIEAKQTACNNEIEDTPLKLMENIQCNTQKKSSSKACVSFSMLLLLLLILLEYFFAYVMVHDTCSKRFKVESYKNVDVPLQIPQTQNISHKILLLSDIHVNILCPFSAFWMKKLRQIIELQHRPEKIIILGDLFRHSDYYYKPDGIYVPPFLQYFQAKNVESLVGCDVRHNKCIYIAGNHDPKEDTNDWKQYFTPSYTTGELITFANGDSANYLTLPWAQKVIDDERLLDLQMKIDESVDILLIHEPFHQFEYNTFMKHYNDLFEENNTINYLSNASIILSGHTHMYNYTTRYDVINDHFVHEITIGTFNYIQPGDHNYGILEIDESAENITVYMHVCHFNFNRIYILMFYSASLIIINIVLCRRYSYKIMLKFLFSFFGMSVFIYILGFFALYPL